MNFNEWKRYIKLKKEIMNTPIDYRFDNTIDPILNDSVLDRKLKILTSDSFIKLLESGTSGKQG